MFPRSKATKISHAPSNKTTNNWASKLTRFGVNAALGVPEQKYLTRQKPEGVNNSINTETYLVVRAFF